MQQDIVPQRRPATEQAGPTPPPSPAPTEPAGNGDTSQPASKPSKAKLLKPPKLVVIGSILLLLAIAGAAYLWFQNNSLQAQLAQKDKAIQSLTANKNPVNTPELNRTNSVEQEKVSEKLPNGQTLTYTQSNENATIVWATYSYDKASGKLVLAVTDDAAIHYLTGLPDDLLKKVCKVDTASKLSVADARTVEYLVKDNLSQKGQTPQCIDLLADPKTNTDAKSQAEAKKVLDGSYSNARRFLNQVTVK